MSLNDRIAVRSSPIHGKGVFARRRLRPGSCIGRFEGSATTRDGPHVLWVMEDDGTERGIRGANALRYLNHSRDPNAEFRADLLFAIRNIQPGAEVIFHYGDDWEDVE